MRIPVASSPTHTRPALKRELGKWDLTAIGVNQVIGSAVFAMPGILAGYVGGWSTWVVALVGLASLLIALSFGEVASRFDATGGPYLYARAAFGRLVGFEVGWMTWITRVASWASVINFLATSLGFYWPVVTTGAARVALMTGIVGAITAVNIRGIRESSFVINVLTIGKLAPIALFILVGAFHVEAWRLAPGALPALDDTAAAALLLIFAFGGYENVPVPAGEAKNPERDVPFGLVMTVVIVALVMIAVQLVSLGTLPGLEESQTPLADASALLMGAAGAALITIGAVLSTTGNNVGGAVAGSRTMFALADQGDLPRVFGRVHETYRTPINAIVITSGVTLALALSGTFAALAQVSAVSRLLVYVATCAATLRLRSATFSGVVPPARFVVPMGPVIPGLAIAISVAILAGATPAQLVSGIVAILAGAVLYVIAIRSARSLR